MDKHVITANLVAPHLLDTTSHNAREPCGVDGRQELFAVAKKTPLKVLRVLDIFTVEKADAAHYFVRRGAQIIAARADLAAALCYALQAHADQIDAKNRLALQ